MPNLQKRLLLLASTSTLALITACGGGGGGNNVRPDAEDDLLARIIPSAEELGVIDSSSDNGTKTFFTAPINPVPTSGDFFSSQQLRFDMNQWYKNDWDGRGQTIAVLDTGISPDDKETISYHLVAQANLRHTIQQGRIIKTNDDSLSLGTHGHNVAQLAAGQFGIAINANIAHGVITDTAGSANRASLFKGIEWATDLNTTALNMAVINLSFTYGGLTIAKDEVRNNRLSLAEREIRRISNTAIDQNIAIVHAAGNDSNENLSEKIINEPSFVDASAHRLGQQLIIVGSTTDNLTLQSSSFPGENSNIQNRFIVGPGVSQIDKKTFAGTSGAAANVSGLIAVMQQRWQHLGGRELTQILLDTANRDFPNYSASLHGMGMLDANAAFSPIGTTSIAFEDQTYSMQSLSVSLPAGYEPVTINTAILDSYQRDFSTQIASISQPHQGHFRYALNQAWPATPRIIDLQDQQLYLGLAPTTQLNRLQSEHNQLGFNQFAQSQQLNLLNLGLYQGNNGWQASVAQSNQTHQQAWLVARQQGQWQVGGYQTQGDSLLNWVGLQERTQYGAFAIWQPAVTQNWLSLGCNWQQGQEDGTQLLTHVTETQSTQWASLHNPTRWLGFQAQLDLFQQQRQLDFTANIAESIGDGRLRFGQQRLSSGFQNQGVSLQLQHPNWQISWLQDRFDQAWLVRYRQNF